EKVNPLLINGGRSHRIGVWRWKDEQSEPVDRLRSFGMYVQLRGQELHVGQDRRGQHLRLRRGELHLLRKLPQEISAFASQRKAARGERPARLSFLCVSRAGFCPPAVRSSRV